MNNPRALLALTLANLALLVFSLVQQMRPAVASPDNTVLRTGGLELIDGQGRVRASLAIVPAGKSPQGVAYPESVLLRLITERGRPAVKISTSEVASTLTLAGPTQTERTYVILQAKGEVSSVRLRNEQGSEQVLQPGS